MDLIEEYNGLVRDLRELGDNLLTAHKNKSACRRARKQSVDLRTKLKSIRQELLKIEKET